MAASPWQREAVFRFYAELNDFLPEQRRRVSFVHRFKGTPSVKDTIEALGVPHPEVDVVLVDGRSVDFAHRLRGGERVAVYPVFERLDVSPLVKLRPAPLREPKFLLDVHLGRLARYLRLAGLDAIHDATLDDPALARRAREERRILLTRDRDLLKRGEVTHGYWVRATDPREQLREVISALQLERHLRPFSRCSVCNTPLEAVAEAQVRDRLPPAVRGRYEGLRRCPGCGRVYWPGSHYRRLARLLEGAGAASRAAGPDIWRQA